MFSLEADLVDQFINHIENRNIYWNLSNILKEFNYSNGKTDIIATDEDTVFAFEAKLDKWRKAINQAYRNTIFADYSYVILPKSRQTISMKNKSEFEKYGVGLILVDEQTAEISITAKKNFPGNNWIVNKAKTMMQEKCNVASISGGCEGVLS